MDEIIGVILAGGESSRFKGAEKVLISLDGETLINRSIRKASMQVDRLVLSVNERISNKINNNIPKIIDSNFSNVGPLGGVFSTLDWITTNYPLAKNVVYFAADVPFFPDDFVFKLINKKNENNINKLFCVSYEGRIQPLFSLWDVSLKKSLYNHLLKKKYKVESFFNENSFDFVELEKTNPPSFFNINTLSDIKKLNSFGLF